MPSREIETDQPAERMADDRRALKLVLGDIAVEIGDRAVDHAGLRIGARRIAAKAVELNQIDGVMFGDCRRNPVINRARARQAGNQDHRAAFAHRGDRNVWQLSHRRCGMARLRREDGDRHEDRQGDAGDKADHC